MVRAYEIARRFHSSTCPYIDRIAINIGTRNAETGYLLHTLNGHTNIVTSVAFSPDNLKIVSASYDSRIKIWNAINGQLLRTLTGHTSIIYCVAFSNEIYSDMDKKLMEYINRDAQ